MQIRVLIYTPTPRFKKAATSRGAICIFLLSPTLVVGRRLTRLNNVVRSEVPVFRLRVLLSFNKARPPRSGTSSSENLVGRR